VIRPLVLWALAAVSLRAGDLEQRLEAVRARYGLPAMAAVVLNADRIVALGAAGVRKLGEPDPVTPQSQWHIGSNTKAMTATMIAALVERGKLEWSATPLQVFPEWEGSLRPEYAHITLEDLLRHRAGIPPETDSREWRDLPKFEGSAIGQRREFAHWMVRQEPANRPGTKNLYSNADYAVAAVMAERVAGQSWEDLLREYVFSPLGIQGGFGWPAADDPVQPWGHFERKHGYRPHNPHDGYRVPVCLAPAGDVHLSIGDYARFLQAHLRGLEDRDDVLKSHTIRFLHAPVEGYALGWGIRQVHGVRRSAHSGSAGTFFALAALWPARDLGVAVVTNAGGDRAEEALTGLMRELAASQP
jgi:CubicO group peptidase (beta-lactamase class C family)